MTDDSLQNSAQREDTAAGPSVPLRGLPDALIVAILLVGIAASLALTVWLLSYGLDFLAAYLNP